ncbi:MAG: glycosyltransferase family 39 protein, partial [Acidobacteriota bacterium]
MLLIVGLALGLRLYAISLYPLSFDEYGSILEAKSVGSNWNSIIYSTLMHFWVRGGAGELWLRLPAAIFGTATVPILFKIGEKFGGSRTALVAGLLAAMSPFNIFHSQEVRFYSFFIFCSAAFMLATTSYVDSRRGKRRAMLVLSTGLVLLVSHFLGVLALYAQGSASLVAANWQKRSGSALGQKRWRS